MNTAERRWRIVVPVADEEAWELLLAEMAEFGLEAVVELEDRAEVYFVRWEAAEGCARALGLAEPEESDAGGGEVFGEHATTELCLELMASVVRSGDVVVDVGSGSGRLARRAVELGAGLVVAVDVDWPAVLASRGQGVQVVQGSVNALRGDGADVVLTNLHLGLWRELAGEIGRVAAAGARLVASGFLVEQEAEARELLRELGWQVRERRERGGWVALAADRTVG